MTDAIEAKGIEKIYAMGDLTVEALTGIDIAIEEGAFVSIMGPSGSGKSTLMHLLGLLDRPSAGSIVINGTEITGLSDTAQSRFRLNTIGFVFQFYSLLTGFTSKEQVALPLIRQGKEKTKAQNKAERALTKVGLGDRIDHRPDELSGGQKQRVAVARAIAVNPDILIADEATSQLDTETSAQIMGLFRDIAGDGHTVVTVNHEQELGLEADRVIRLVDGSIVDRDWQPD